MATLCVAPNEIHDGDLLAYLDGAASTAVTDHLGRCTACQVDVADLAALDTELVAALFRAACPPTEDLLAYQVNLLGTGEQAQIRLHVQGCAHCQGELTELAAVPAIVSALSLPARVFDAGRRWLDALLVVPAAQPALQLRGNEQSSQVYQAGPFQIILAKVPPVVAENIWQVEGQLLARDHSDAAGDLANFLSQADVQITLLKENPAPIPVAQDTVDDLGFFLLEGVESGVYALQIDTPTTTIRLADFKIP